MRWSTCLVASIVMILTSVGLATTLSVRPAQAAKFRSGTVPRPLKRDHCTTANANRVFQQQFIYPNRAVSPEEAAYWQKRTELEARDFEEKMAAQERSREQFNILLVGLAVYLVCLGFLKFAA